MCRPSALAQGRKAFRYPSSCERQDEGTAAVDEGQRQHYERFRKVSIHYPRHVLDAYGGDFRRAMAHNDEAGRHDDRHLGEAARYRRVARGRGARSGLRARSNLPRGHLGEYEVVVFERPPKDRPRVALRGQTLLLGAEALYASLERDLESAYSRGGSHVLRSIGSRGRE